MDDRYTSIHSHGVYTQPDCSSETPNHGVLVVGYATLWNGHKSKDYWILKNRFVVLKLIPDF